MEAVDARIPGSEDAPRHSNGSTHQEAFVSQVLLVAGEQIARYGFPDGHPFGPDRHDAFMSELMRQGLDQRVSRAAPRLATREELQLFHTGEYIDLVRSRSISGLGYLDRGDTPAWKGVFEAASHVVGATLEAVDAVMDGSAQRAFVPIAGLHHAARTGAAGFCVFNDCGIAIEHLRSSHGLKRIAYVDIDAHHGDGVFYAFESDPDVLFADLHEDGRYLYPGTGNSSETGTGAAQATKLNIPMQPGSTDVDFDAVWPQVIDYLEARQPEFILLQCGADSVGGDPLTHMQYSPEVHERAAGSLCDLADRLGHGRVVGLGGGGYNRRNLALAWTGVVRAFIEATERAPLTARSDRVLTR